MKSMFFILCMSLFITHSTPASAETALRPFKSDYCSNWPEGTRNDPTRWANCCFVHDLPYWIGGTKSDRKEADKALKECVKLSGSTLESFLIYMGVRMGGRPGDGDNNFSWGFGWEGGRGGYSPLTAEEIAKAREVLQVSPSYKDSEKRVFIEEFLDRLESKRI